MFTKARYLLCFQHLLEIEDMFNEDIYKVYPVTSIHIYIYTYVYTYATHAPDILEVLLPTKKNGGKCFLRQFSPTKSFTFGSRTKQFLNLSGEPEDLGILEQNDEAEGFTEKPKVLVVLFMGTQPKMHTLDNGKCHLLSH